MACRSRPPLGLFVYFYSRRIKEASRAVKKKESELMSGVAEVLASIQVVQAFAREDYEDRRFNSESRQNVRAGLQARSVKAKLSPMVDVIVAVGTCVVLGYGVRLVSTGQLTTGVLIVFLMYLKKTYKPIKRSVEDGEHAVESGGQLRADPGSGRRRQRDPRSCPAREVAPPFKGLVEFDHITFRLQRRCDRPERRQPPHRAGPGRRRSSDRRGRERARSRVWCRDSSIRSRAAVKIDGVDIREYTLKSLRDQISFVLQDSLLFRGTIWENISYGRPDADPEDTIQAAQHANAHDFIMALPHGYGTMVAERGTTLSGGQRRRIAIARAMVRNTPILILDEPTTGLDAESEHAVSEALERLMKGRTCIVVAHHLNTICRADVIFVVKDTAVVERGTHEQLLATGGLYSELYEMQRRHGPKTLTI